MRKILKKVKETLLYGGLEKEQYRAIAPEIDEANRKSIIILSLACMAILTVRLSLQYSEVPHTNKVVFILAIILFGCMAAANALLKKKPPDRTLFSLFIHSILSLGRHSFLHRGRQHP